MTIQQQHTYMEETHDIEVEVIPSFISEKSSLTNQYFFFSYQVTIKNIGNKNVQVLNRHWIIRDGNKKQRFVNGEGIVGEQPHLAPNESFQYTSFSPLSTPTGNMRGKFELKDEEGNRFWVKVPLFFFRLPLQFLQ